MITMTSKKLLSLTISATMIFVTAVWAQEGATERDPFYSTEKRPSASAPVPAGNAWGRDPFNNPLAGRMPARRERGPEDRSKGLTGIIYSKDIRLAIINGEALSEGSSIGERKVESIGERSVKLTNAAGAIEEIFLQNFSIRK
jgi:hypothetical protein